MKYIAAVDQSTSSSKAFLIDENGEIVRRSAHPHKQYYPKPGLAEHDAEEIYQNVVTGIDEVIQGIPKTDIAALALTNQRETTVLWDRATGKPVCPAVVWQDTRGKPLCEELTGEADYILQKTGSAVSPYLPASKIGVLLRENPALKARAESGGLCMGTIESYLVYRLTGNFCADVSNASRTQLMDIHTLCWDERLLSLFGIPKAMLPERILFSDACFGEYLGIPVTGVLGDSFATLFGQGCQTFGTAKVSYGTGTSVMANIGNKVILPKSGLTTAIAYGYKGKISYEIEGNITCSGDTLVWLCRGLNLFESPDELEALAKSVPDAQGVQLVPAMAGLGAPFFDTEARAILCGMSRGTTRAHIARAALESMAQRAADVFEALRDEGVHLKRLMVDGGGAKNALLMQLQADLLDCELICSQASELSALGAAYMAGLTTGVFGSFEEIPARQKVGKTYISTMDSITRSTMRDKWRKAIERARL